MPLQVIGQRTQEDVTSDSIIGLVLDGPYFELHSLEAAEGSSTKLSFLEATTSLAAIFSLGTSPLTM